MAKKKGSNFLDSGVFRVILMGVAWVLTTVVLAFSVLTFVNVKNDHVDVASHYLVGVFISLGLTRFASYLKDRKKTSFLRAIILLAIDVGLGVLVMFAKYNPYIFSISAGLFALSIIFSRIIKLIDRHSTRDIVLNVIVILFVIALAIGFFQKVDSDVMGGIVLAECVFIAACAFVEAAMLSLSQLKLNTLGKIIFRTYALEIIFGLLTLIVAASLVLMYEEPTMTYFPNALWYCFAVVTTIGFGDFYATTLIGRLVTVLLGIYGIIVVAVITSIIVNFYNETSGKEDAKELKNIKKEHNDK